MNNRFIGLSTDTKPTGLEPGATFFEYDTKNMMITPDDGTSWTPKIGHAQYSNTTGADAIAMTLTPGIAWQLEGIRVHLDDAGGAGNLTAKIDNGEGAAYDIVLLTQDMTAVTDLMWSPEDPIEFRAGDSLVIEWANAGEKTYGLEIVYKGI